MFDEHDVFILQNILSVDDRVEMALSTRRKKILAWYLLEASNEFLRTLLEKVVDEEPLLDERSLRKRRPRRHEEEGDKLVQALLLCSADQRLLRRLIADRLKRIDLLYRAVVPSSCTEQL